MPKAITDLTGRTFRQLTAIRHVGFSNGNEPLWEFRCDCGATVIKATSRVTGGYVSRCVACQRANRRMDNDNRFIGRTFGYLRVLSADPNSEQHVICECVCKTIKAINKHSLFNVRSPSCGCMQQTSSRVANRKNEYIGVILRPNNTYHTQLTVNGKRYHLGHFKNKIEAAQAVDKKAIELLGYPLNFSDEREHDGEATEVLTVTPDKWETGR